MKRKLIPLMALSLFGVLVTSCGGAKTYKKGVNLNYALLIGQVDHNDSAARTAGIREALHTRTSNTMINANMEKPVEGKLTIKGKEYIINEIEHQEMKAQGGATWDAATATTTTQTWITKHSKDKWETADGKQVEEQGINFFVSNNDGMAEGATSASNWKKGTPIFGYDSNSTTLKKIKEGYIMGTINQNAQAQTAGIFMVARNAIDGLTGADVYTKGFKENSTNGYGKIESEFAFTAETKAFLVNNYKIDTTNIDNYIKDGQPLPVDDPTLLEKVTKGTTKQAKVWMNYYSATDTFLNSTMDPLFKAYADEFNFALTVQKGDGNAETSVSNTLDATETGAFDAYLINMVKTTSLKNYLDIIASKTNATAENPTSKPVIFWNRQGTLADGSVDAANMKDARFKNLFYVGFDAVQGGKLQGEMIVDYLEANIDNLTK